MEQMWEQYESEGSKAYEAFACYRDMGRKRSISKVAKELGKNDSLISRWSKTYEWVHRVNQYDAYMDKVRLEEREKQTKQFEELKLKYGILMTYKGGQILESMDPKKIKISDAIRMVDFGVKLEREATDHELEMIEKELSRINNPPHEVVVRVVTAEDIRKENEEKKSAC
ncbi:MAG: hypothetical protein GYA60_10425 [Candidatus Methanofastidiosa archaeon]|nr:hypothetical protein [Candidatus Methanofastidiosa archaeon]